MPTNFRSPIPGQPVAPFVGNHVLWQRLLDMLQSYEAGNFGNRNRPSAVTTPGLHNDTTDTIYKKHDVKLLDSLKQTVATAPQDLKDMQYISPIFTAQDPTWATALNLPVPLRQAFAPGDTQSIRTSRYQTVPVTMVNDTDQYVMFDPSDATKLKTNATSGMYRIIGIFQETDTEGDRAVIDTQEEQPIWQYETLEAFVAGPPRTAKAKLLDLEKTVYADDNTPSGDDESIQVIDPLGSAGDTGLCVFSHGKFYAIAGGGGGGNRTFKTPSGGIPARDDSAADPVAPNATCPEWTIDDTDGNKLKANGQTEVIWNIFSTAIAGEVFIEAQQQPDGTWVVDAEDCDKTLCEAIEEDCDLYSIPDPPSSS